MKRAETVVRAVNAVIAGVSCLVCHFLIAEHSVAADEKRNVLFIISDDLTAEALSCYGNKQCQTPNIDRLAQRGMRFTRTYCQFPVCGPSRAALMSGMYPQAIGVSSNGASERFTKNLGDRPSLTQHFRRHGYYSARVSKIYHMRVPGDITAGVDGPDHAASWSERFNCQAPEWMTKGEHKHLTNEKLKKDPDQHYGLGFGGAFYVVRDPTDGAAQADTQAATKAIELLEKHCDKPFFLAVGLVRPHLPLVAPTTYFDSYASPEMSLPTRIDDDWNDIPRLGIPKNSAGIGLGGRIGRQREVLAAYYACVSFMDAQVGRVLSALDRLGLRDNTIVVFTSDHGYHLGEHDFWQKMSLHEESTRIPLIIAAPDGKPQVTASLAQQIDLYPTLAEMCGLPEVPHWQGRSLVAALNNPRHQVHESVYCYKGNGHLLRTDRWAYLAYKDGTTELYDMQTDPRQFESLSDDPRHAEVFGRMQKQLQAKLDQIGKGPS